MRTTRSVPALAVLASLALISLPALAQVDSALLSKVSFNLTNPGGKSLAMGGAFTAIADDATTALANPAGLGLLSSVEVGVSGKRFDETIGLVTARASALGSLTAPWSPIRQSDSQIGLVSTSLEYAGVVLPVSRRLVVAFSYAENLRFEGSADADGYQYIEFRDNRSGDVTRRDFLFEYREYGAVSLRNRLAGFSFGYRVTDRVRIGAGITLNRAAFELDGDGAGPHRIVNRTFRSPTLTETRTVTMAVTGFGGTKTAFVAGLHADLDSRATVSIGASYRTAAKTRGNLVLDGDVPTSLQGETSRPFTFSVPRDASLGVAVRPVPGMTIALEGQWVGYDSTFDVPLPIQSYSGLVGPDPGFPVDGVLAEVQSQKSVWIPRAGIEYVATAGATRVAFRLGYHREPAHGVTADVKAVEPASGTPFDITDPPFSESVRTVFDGGKADDRFSGGLGLTIGRALSVDAAFDVGRNSRRFSTSLFWRF
jgi:long-subunit fatty acid transport protein